MEFIDFRSLQRSSSIDLIFPGWKKGETVAFLSPHDDDVLLGAGYLLLATIENKGNPLLLIFCSGDAGYSSVQEKESITQKRKDEAFQAYGMLGLQKKNIFCFDISDFCLMPHVTRKFPASRGIFDEQVRLFRKEKVSRVVFSSGHFEHWDHTAVFLMGIYTSPQAGDPVLADIGSPFKAKSYYVYSVWARFEPLKSESDKIRAEKGILVDEEVEEKIRESIKRFSSQKKIFKSIIAHREKRRLGNFYLELYKEAEVRAQTDFKPYFNLLKKCEKIK
jgi:LmbE family N-acetylglucosaminyl deacetylase